MNRNLITLSFLSAITVIIAFLGVFFIAASPAHAYTSLYDHWSDGMNDSRAIIANEAPWLAWYAAQNWVGVSADEATYFKICASSAYGGYPISADGAWYHSPDDNRVIRWIDGSWQLYPAWTPHLNQLTCASPYPSVSLSVSPSTIQSGESSTLSWSSQVGGCTPGNFSNYTYIPEQCDWYYNCYGDPYDWYGNYSCGYEYSCSGGYYYQPPSGSMGVAPSETTTYSYQCESSVAYATLTVAPPPAAPQASFAANPTTINLGQSTTLTWSSTDATSCSGNAFETGGSTGTSVSVSPSGTFTYSLTCYGAGGQVTKYATVTVNSTPTLSATCGVYPTSASTGQSVTWSAVASGGTGSYSYSWSGTDGLSGTTASVQKSYTTTGTKTGSVSVTSGGQTVNVNCSSGGNIGGNGSGDINIGYATPTAVLSADSTSIVSGESTTLRWTSTDATSCTGTNFSTANAANNSSPGVTVSPNTTTTYSIDCVNGSQHGYSSQQITVQSAPTLSISASPSQVRSGESTTISWNGGTATSCSVLGPGLIGSGVTGSQSVSVTAQSTYTLTCSKASLSYQQSVTVGLVPGFREE